MIGVQIFPVTGIGEVRTGDDVAMLIFDHLREETPPGMLEDHDVVVVTQKVVSKAEGRLVPEEDKPAAVATESARTLRRTRDMVIAETHHGLVCANAGVDASNVPPGFVALLPVDPDASARRLRSRLEHLAGRTIGVVISDTFGRAWRLGQTDVAIGVAGIDPFLDYRGSPDREGRELTATRICVADELAAAAELVMGKASGTCAAVVRGAPVTFARGEARSIVRPPTQDLFR